MDNPVCDAGQLTVFGDGIRIFRVERITRYGCGNKEFKLTDNLLQIKRDGGTSVLSFGGAWSNHLHAFALACEALGLRAFAAVRGEERSCNALLQHAMDHGLQVIYLSRAEYRDRYSPLAAQRLCESLGCDSWLPEGGANSLAVSACRALAGRVNHAWPEVFTDLASEAHSGCGPSHLALAVGTGATLAGVVSGAEPTQTVIGVPVVQDDRLFSQVTDWVEEAVALPDSGSPGAEWELLESAYPARYGKVDKSLLDFVLDTHDRTGIVLDPVYNAKALHAVMDSGLAGRDGNEVVFIHTGGIVGCLGWVEKLQAECDSAKVRRYLADVHSILGF